MEFLTIFIPILVLIGIALLLLCIRILIKKNGKFSSQHIGQSKALKAKGVGCAQSQDKEERRKK